MSAPGTGPHRRRAAVSQAPAASRAAMMSRGTPCPTRTWRTMPPMVESVAVAICAPRLSLPRALSGARARSDVAAGVEGAVEVIGYVLLLRDDRWETAAYALHGSV